MYGNSCTLADGEKFLYIRLVMDKDLHSCVLLQPNLICELLITRNGKANNNCD